MKKLSEKGIITLSFLALIISSCVGTNNPDDTSSTPTSDTVSPVEDDPGLGEIDPENNQKPPEENEYNNNNNNIQETTEGENTYDARNTSTDENTDDTRNTTTDENADDTRNKTINDNPPEREEGINKKEEEELDNTTKIDELISSMTNEDGEEIKKEEKDELIEKAKILQQKGISINNVKDKRGLENISNLTSNLDETETKNTVEKINTIIENDIPIEEISDSKTLDDINDILVTGIDNGSKLKELVGNGYDLSEMKDIIIEKQGERYKEIKKRTEIMADELERLENNDKKEEEELDNTTKIDELISSMTNEDGEEIKKEEKDELIEKAKILQQKGISINNVKDKRGLENISNLTSNLDETETKNTVEKINTIIENDIPIEEISDSKTLDDINDILVTGIDNGSKLKELVSMRGVYLVWVSMWSLQGSLSVLNNIMLDVLT